MTTNIERATLKLLPTSLKIRFLTDLFYFSLLCPCCLHGLNFFLSAFKRNPSAFRSQSSLIICSHYDLFFSVTSHPSLHFSQLKIAIMDISNQVSFDFHSLFLSTHLCLTPPFVHCQLLIFELSLTCCISLSSLSSSSMTVCLMHSIRKQF